MKGYKAMANWAKDLGDKARERLGCRRVKGRYVVPSESTIRKVLISIEPDALDRALQQWNERFAPKEDRLAVDGIEIQGKLITADASAHPEQTG